MPRGGRRAGAGRKKGDGLNDRDRKDIAQEFIDLMHIFAHLGEPRPYRGRAISIIAAEWNISRRMVVRCYDEFGPAIKKRLVHHVE